MTTYIIKTTLASSIKEPVIIAHKGANTDGRTYYLVHPDTLNLQMEEIVGHIIGHLPSNSSGESTSSLESNLSAKSFLSHDEAVEHGHLLHNKNNSAFIKSTAKSIQSTGQFSAYEAALLEKLFTKEENKEQISKWIDLLAKGKKKEVIKEVQQFINKNIRFRSMFKMAFFKAIERWKNSSGKQRALHVTKKVLEIPFSPVILLYKLGKTIAIKDKRQSAKHMIKAALSGDSIARYHVRNKFVKGLIKSGVAGAIATTIALEILSLGAATPVIAGFAGVAGASIALKTGHDIANKKHPTLILAEILGSVTQSSTEGAILGASIGGFVELVDIIHNAINSSHSLHDSSSSNIADMHSEPAHSHSIDGGGHHSLHHDAHHTQHARMEGLKYAKTGAEASEVVLKTAEAAHEFLTHASAITTTTLRVIQLSDV